MPKAITQPQLNKIARMIREWPEEDAFHWENICTGSKSILDFKPTRQALSAKPMLKNAYTVKKAQLKQAVSKFKDVPRPQSILDAMNKISRLQQENDALRAELNKMAEVAQRFIYNASIAGLSNERLMAPLPKSRM
ncbi:MAG: hypothetical protein ACI9XK_000093 [Granulosicoccus sp.]|jgi:hypothetical protein